MHRCHLSIRLSIMLATVVMTISSCGDNATTPPQTSVQQAPGDDIGYHENTDVVVLGNEIWVVKEAPANDCVNIQGQCIQIADLKLQNCGDKNAQADIVVLEGQMVKVICYPPKSSGVNLGSATVNNDGQTVLPQNASQKVIVFGEETNGKPIAGDVRLDAEAVSLIGNGVDKTILNGNLSIASNGSHIRGLTINGNVTFEENANESSIAFCKIKGNLIVKSNNVMVLSCQVFGNIELQGNGEMLFNNGLGGNLQNEGNGATCQNNYSFNDQNSNFIIEDNEHGTAIDCNDQKKQ